MFGYNWTDKNTIYCVPDSWKSVVLTLKILELQTLSPVWRKQLEKMVSACVPLKSI